MPLFATGAGASGGGVGHSRVENRISLSLNFSLLKILKVEGVNEREMSQY